MKNNKNDSHSVEAVSVSNLSPHSRALYETGKTILIETINTGREFCKFMVSISFGAIPIYLGILTFMLPEKYVLGEHAGLTIAIPAILYFFASIGFVIGYLPITTEFSLDLVGEIERERRKVIKHRNRFITIGMIFFSLATSYAIYVIVINIGTR